MPAVSDLDTLLRNMHPQLNPGVYVFATLSEDKALDLQDVIATIREAEGLSVIVEASIAIKAGLDATYACSWITLNVHSDLAAVGLTAAFATALGQAGISCNVVAGTRHDHLFVACEQAQAALDTLLALQRAASQI